MSLMNSIQKEHGYGRGNTLYDNDEINKVSAAAYDPKPIGMTTHHNRRKQSHNKDKGNARDQRRRSAETGEKRRRRKCQSIS